MHAQIEHVVTNELSMLPGEGKCVATGTQTRTMRPLWRYRHFTHPLPSVKSSFYDVRLFFQLLGLGSSVQSFNDGRAKGAGKDPF
jgi:hypothetical protein